MSTARPRLTVVIPAYNEEARLGPTLDRMQSWLRQGGRSFEVLLVDDGSSDGTARVGREYSSSHPEFVVHEFSENRGKGAAVREGFRRSRGEVVLFSDADLSTPIEEVAAMEVALEEGADLVIGSRGLPGSELVVRQTWYREWMGKTFNRIVRLATGIPFRDTQCGFKLLRGEHARALAGDMREDGFSFDVELILLARRRGLAIREMPVVWKNEEGSRVNPVGDSLAMLLSLRRILGRTGRYRG